MERSLHAGYCFLLSFHGHLRLWPALQSGKSSQLQYRAWWYSFNRKLLVDDGTSQESQIWASAPIGLRSWSGQSPKTSIYSTLTVLLRSEILCGMSFNATFLVWDHEISYFLDFLGFLRFFSLKKRANPWTMLNRSFRRTV